jgi:sec-independent protein translocase protein TatB
MSLAATLIATWLDLAAKAAALPAAPLPASLQAYVQLATFGVGDTLLIVVIALIVFGPKKLPEISRQLGKLVYEFRKASNDFKFQIEEELRSAEQAERQKQLETQAASAQPATPVAMSAVDTVSAEPAAATDNVTEHTILPPTVQPPTFEPPTSQPLTSQPLTIQPPASGLPIEGQRPYGGAPAVDPSAGVQSADEIAANSQEAVRAADALRAESVTDIATEQADRRSADAIPTQPVPSHHG